MNETTTSDIRVADLMTQSSLTANKDDDLMAALAVINLHGLNSLPVVDKSGKLCGILSVSDLVLATYSLQCDLAVLDNVPTTIRKTLTDALAEDNRSRTVEDFMTTAVETIHEDATAREAAHKLIVNGIHHLPVVNQQQRLVGFLSATDIVRAVAYEK